jgi:diguanylate cyclase (GGDEF)-like protein/PAS domain S-box-containing protein
MSGEATDLDLLATSSRRASGDRVWSRDEAVRRAAPFAAVALLSFGLAPLLPGALSIVPYTVSIALTLLAVGWVVVIGSRAPELLRIVPPLVYIVSVALLREAVGGAVSGYSVLFLVPVVWSALYRPLWEVVTVLGAIAAAVILPVAVQGPPRYPTNDYGRAALLVAVGTSIGLTIDRLVRRSERQTQELSDTVDGALDAFFAFDEHGTTVAWNDAAEQIFGWRAAEVIGRHPVEYLFTEQERDELSSMLAVRPEDGENLPSMRFLRPMRIRNGDMRTMRIAVQAMRTTRGLRYNVFAHDVTDEHHAQLALASSERRFRNTVEASPIGMVVASLDGTIEQVNEAYCTLVGRDADVLLGTPIERYIDASDRTRELDKLRRLLNGEIAHYDIESRFLHGTGHTLWTQNHVTVLDDEHGAPALLMMQILDITERRRFEDQLQHLADHDPLTGLLNRRGFAAVLKAHVDTCTRYGAQGALMMLDLDGFKYVNDTLGHDAGDELVIAVAQILQQRLRTTDTVARLGGDEFAVLLPRATFEDTEEVAGSLLAAVSAASLFNDDSIRPVTVSIGIARFDEPGVGADEVVTNADLAMYDAKEMGRNRFSHYSTDEHRQPRIKARMKWLDRIAHALDHDGLVLEAMPILDLSTNRVDQYELLLRMKNGDGSTVPPASFLYIAERFDMIDRIDRWVITQAIDLLAKLDDQRVSLTVNISGKSIADPQLLPTIDRRLKATSVDPSRLIIELTETAAVADILAARRFALSINMLGCRFALDDFGAGFGSFYYLKHLPFDVLKIDGEFVKNCSRELNDQHIIHSLVQLAHGMGKKTVAEFTADEATLDTVRRLGVDAAQGYQVGLPVPADAQLAVHSVA